MQPSDQVYVIKEFIYNGNRYPAQPTPYLYGQLPVGTRDNLQFVVPVEKVTVTTENIPTNVTKITKVEDFNSEVVRETINREVVEPLVVTIIEEPVIKEEVKVIEEEKKEEVSPVKSTRKSRKTITSTEE